MRVNCHLPVRLSVDSLNDARAQVALAFVKLLVLLVVFSVALIPSINWLKESVFEGELPVLVKVGASFIAGALLFGCYAFTVAPADKKLRELKRRRNADGAGDAKS